MKIIIAVMDTVVKKMKLIDIIIRAFALLPYVYLLICVKEAYNGRTKQR